jgi:hypothetical protein
VTSLPPSRDLPPGALERRRAHLLSEIATPSRRGAFTGRRAAPALAALVVLSAVALLLASPWQGSPTLTERALAAIGEEAVLHVVTERADWFPPLVNIETGELRRQTIRTEIWFDEGRALKRTVQRLDGIRTDEVLETPEGGFTQGGPLITCAWIAAHPVEATKLGVSCNENMENGTTPREIPETPPTLEPTLAGFVDGYRSALESGRATELRRDTIDGRPVVWLRFPPSANPRTGAPKLPRTDVAVDAETFKPLRIHSGDERSDTTVLVAETLPYEDELFPRPELAPPGPSFGGMGERETVELAKAARLLGRSPLWLGAEWQGFRLVEVRRVELKTGYPRSSGREPEFGDAVQLAYEDSDGRALTLDEAASCHFGLARGMCGPRGPREGELRPEIFPRAFVAQLDGLHVTVEHRAANVEPLELARALAPVPEGWRGP